VPSAHNNKMQFTGSILLLAVADKSFIGKDGTEVKYSKATFITENGDVVSMTTTKEVLDSFKDRTRIQGVGSFDLSSDFKGNPRVKLTSFVAEKQK